MKPLMVVSSCLPVRQAGLLVISILAGCQTEELKNQRTQELKTSAEGGSASGGNIQQLISLLGSDDWPTREKAQEELTKLGETFIEDYRKAKLVAGRQRPSGSLNGINEGKPRCLPDYSLLKAFANALQKATKDKDPEIRLRANTIRQHLYTLSSPKIAFQSDQDNKWVIWNIYVMDTDGKNQTRLTKNQAYVHNESPAWSPDGTKIAFVSSRDRNSEIYVMDADSKNQTRLTKNQTMDESPVWSPDGTKIAFHSNRGGNYEIYVMDTDGKNQKRLTENKARDENPTWSPDGKRIAFQSEQDGNWEIYVMDTDGKNQKRLTENKTYDETPDWSPDGTKIAFYSTRDGRPGIYVMDADGKNQTKLTQDQAIDYSPAWGPWLLKEISELLSGEG